MKKRPVCVFVLACLGLLVFGLHRSAAQQEELDPLKVCKDTDKLVFENTFVKVTEERVPAGVTQQKHQHAHGVTVALAGYDVDATTFPDNQTAHRHTDFGQVRWSDAVIHQTHNTGKDEQHVIRIELKY